MSVDVGMTAELSSWSNHEVGHERETIHPPLSTCSWSFSCHRWRMTSIGSSVHRFLNFFAALSFLHFHQFCLNQLSKPVIGVLFATGIYLVIDITRIRSCTHMSFAHRRSSTRYAPWLFIGFSLLSRLCHRPSSRLFRSRSWRRGYKIVRIDHSLQRDTEKTSLLVDNTIALSEWLPFWIQIFDSLWIIDRSSHFFSCTDTHEREENRQSEAIISYASTKTNQQ